MRQLFFASVISPVALLAPAFASAQTTVSGASATNVATSTAGDVTVATGATLTPAAGAAVTIDSNNSVTNNGTISFSGVDGATGILAQSGRAGTITNAGSITVIEPVTATDVDNDGDVDGPLANGTGRYGIHVVGAGAFTGSITDSGTTTVVGNASAGVAVDSQLVGSVTQSGTIGVQGDNSYGLRTAAVTGDVTLSGTTAVTGQNTVAVALDGDVGGAVSVSGAVTATGFRGGAAVYASPDADDLLIGGPALRIGGGVAGGVSVTSTGALTSYGSAPALLIGSTANTTIGLVSGGTTGLALGGTILGSGVNVGVSAQGAQIGGQGGTVTVAGGIALTGTLTAVASQASATGLMIGSGAATPTLTVSGTLGATAGTVTDASVALLVQAGATLPSLVNSGTITAANNGTTGTSTAIRDLSGTLTSITNSGTIGAALATGYQAAQATAIDLSANTSGVTIANGGTGTPAIAGAVITGSGNDVVSVPVGSISGAMSLGGGNNTVALSGTGQIAGAIDFGAGAGTLTLAGTSVLNGDLTFGAGSSMTLADSSGFVGAVVQNGNRLALAVNGGAFAPTNAGAIALSSLNVGATGVLGVLIDPTAGTATRYDVSGAATLASGAAFRLGLSHFVPGTQTYTILDAGTLTAGGTPTLASAGLPYLYDATVTADTGAGTVTLTIGAKSAAELGLDRSGATALPVVVAEGAKDAKLEAAFLSVDDADGFRRLLGETLPEHAGGLYLSTADASRVAASLATDPSTPRGGGLGIWLAQLGQVMRKGQGDTEAYTLGHYGLAGGAEQGLGPLGTVGLQFDWSYHDISDVGNQNHVTGNMTEIGGYWRAGWGGFRVHARGAYGFEHLTSSRELIDPAAVSDVIYTARAGWSGHSTAFDAGASYELAAGRFIVRPEATVDYFRLSERAHDETGGGAGFDLDLAQRVSDATTGEFDAALGYKLSRDPDVASRVELVLGDRQRLSGGVGKTVVSYADGTGYTLTPDDLLYGPEAKLRLAIGSDLVSAIGQVEAQKTEGRVAAGLSAGIRLRL